MPDKGVGGVEIVGRGGRRREPLERVGDALQQAGARSVSRIVCPAVPCGQAGSADAITAPRGPESAPYVRALPFYRRGVPMCRRTPAPAGDGRSRLPRLARGTISRSMPMPIARGLCPRTTRHYGPERLVQFLPLILIFVVFYFLLIRPQQKKLKEHATMLDGAAARRPRRDRRRHHRHGRRRWSARRRSRSISPRSARAGAAQHDHERPGQARPGRGARGGQGARRQGCQGRGPARRAADKVQ